MVKMTIPVKFLKIKSNYICHFYFVYTIYIVILEPYNLTTTFAYCKVSLINTPFCFYKMKAGQFELTPSKNSVEDYSKSDA